MFGPAAEDDQTDILYWHNLSVPAKYAHRCFYSGLPWWPRTDLLQHIGVYRRVEHQPIIHLAFRGRGKYPSHG